jgi:hypothetical protein
LTYLIKTEENKQAPAKPLEKDLKQTIKKKEKKANNAAKY